MEAIRRLRAWWATKEGTERAGLAAGFLFVVGVIVYFLLPPEMQHSVTRAMQDFGKR